MRRASPWPSSRPRPRVVRKHLHGHLGGHHRAAQIHQHQHTVARIRALDRLQHQCGVGPERVVRHVEASRRLQLHVLTGHLSGQLDHAFGKGGAVGDDDDADRQGGYNPSPYAR